MEQARSGNDSHFDLYAGFSRSQRLAALSLCGIGAAWRYSLIEPVTRKRIPATTKTIFITGLRPEICNGHYRQAS